MTSDDWRILLGLAAIVAMFTVSAEAAVIYLWWLATRRRRV